MDEGSIVTIPDSIDQAAATNSDAIFAYQPGLKTNSQTDLEWTVVTFGELGRAVNAAAWWIEETLGVAKEEEAIGFLV